RFGWTPAGEIILEADISPEVAYLLGETPLSQTQEITPLDDGSDWYRLVATITDDQESKWWVYGLNRNIRVTSPSHW
ncbi:WYL domain-containing protein, partial [Gilvimarinus sp. 1_MG-2023]